MCDQKGDLVIDKEVLFRVVRIILVILFVFFVSSVRNVTMESYEDANKIVNSLNASLQIVKISDGKIIGMPLSDEDAIKDVEKLIEDIKEREDRLSRIVGFNIL